MLERYSIPEGDADIWRRKFANLHNAQCTQKFVKNKDLITWEEQTFHQVTLPRKLKLSESIALIEISENSPKVFTENVSTERRKPIKELNLQSVRHRLSSLLDHINYLAEKEEVDSRTITAYALQLVSNDFVDRDTSYVGKDIALKGKFSDIQTNNFQ